MSDLVGHPEDRFSRVVALTPMFHDQNFQEGFENLSCLEQCVLKTSFSFYKKLPCPCLGRQPKLIE